MEHVLTRYGPREFCGLIGKLNWGTAEYARTTHLSHAQHARANCAVRGASDRLKKEKKDSRSQCVVRSLAVDDTRVTRTSPVLGVNPYG